MTCFIHKLPASDAPWAYAIEFDYNAEMVEGIKLRIPSRARSWKPELKKWYFKADVIDTVCLLATVYCGRYVHVEPIEEEEEAPALPAKTVAAYKTLHLLPTAPPSLVSAAYKALAKEVHPDRGGSTATMQEINLAYSLLKREHA